MISAYRDGGAIIDKIKLKRAARKRPAPSRLLEDSIDNAPEEINRETERGRQRFGRAFEEGDHIAVIALQQITIQLQGSLLEKLRNAAFDDEATDFIYLVDAADMGRDRTIATLLELRQRLLQAQPIAEVAMPKMSNSPNVREATPARSSPIPIPRAPSATLDAAARNPAEDRATSPPTNQPIAMTASQYFPWSRDLTGPRKSSRDKNATPGASDDGNPPGAGRRRHSSLLSILSRHHRSSGDSVPTVSAIAPMEETPRTSSLSLATSPLRSTPLVEGLETPPFAQSPAQFRYEQWEDNPAEIWGASPERRDTVRSQSLAVEEQLSPKLVSRSLSSAPSISSVSTNTPRRASAQENEYLGFCKSAWRLQTGDRSAMTKCKEFNDGWSQSTVYYLGCGFKKCAFAGHIAMDRIWGKVWSVEAKGIKFRWPFLAKSHVLQNKVKDHQYAYQCMFCVFLGDQSPVYHGTDLLLDHVQTHRDQSLGEVVLYRAKCIAGRVAEDGEEFDINLAPLDPRERVARKQSDVLSDDLLGGPSKTSTDAQDSMFTPNEPWNAGLSEFHWSGGVDRSELE